MSLEGGEGRGAEGRGGGGEGRGVPSVIFLKHFCCAILDDVT